MAQSTLSQRLSFEGLEDITARLKVMGDAGQRSLEQIRTATGDTNAAFGHLSGVVNELQGMTRVLGALGQGGHAAAGGVGAFGRTVEGIDFEHTAQNLGLLLRGMGVLDSRSIEVGQSLAKLGGVFTGVVGAIGTAVVAFGAISVAAAEATRTIGNQASLLGFTRKEYEGLKAAAAQVGVTTEDLNRGLDRFSANLGKAKEADEKLRDSFGITQEKNRIALAKMSVAADENVLALDRNRNKQLSLARAIDDARMALEKAENAFKHHTDSVEKAHLTAEKAQITYDKLKASFNTTGMSANDARLAQIALTEAQLAAKEAVDGIHEAEVKRLEEAANLIKMHAKVKEAQNALTQAQKEARIEIEKGKIARDDERLKLDEIAHSATEAKNVFQRLNVEIGGGRDQLDIFEEFVGKLNAVSDAATRNALAREAFGRGYANLGPILQLTRERLQLLREVSDKYTFESTPAEITAAAKLNVAYDTMKIALEGVKNAIGNIVGTNFVSFFQGIADAIADHPKEIRAFFADISESMGRWGAAIKDIAIPALKILGALLMEIGKAIGYVKGIFDGLAASINRAFGTKFTGEDFIAGIIAIKLAISLLLPLIARLILGIGTTLGTAMVAAVTGLFDLGLAFMGLGSSVAVLELALGPVGWIALGLTAITAALSLGVGGLDSWFKAIRDGFETLMAFIELLKATVGWLERKAGLESSKSDAAPSSDSNTPSSQSPASPSSDPRYMTGVGAYNPLTAHQTGGWVGERPVSAESGEFITRKSMSQRFSGLLEAINSGNLGNIADRMSSVLPAPLAMAGGAPAARAAGNDQAMFHLTIGDTTFKGLTAPRDTAEALLQHARKSNVLSAGKKQSWYGS